jgi:quercetin dioxygenase-like cupin family protein
MRIVADESVQSSRADLACSPGECGVPTTSAQQVLSGGRALRFLYEPGARSFWHVHECDQAIVGVYGEGLVAWEGLGPPLALRPGDWWHVEPGVPHWHGATAGASFAHLAVTVCGATTWLHEVSETDYRAHEAAQAHLVTVPR